jgi:hypothetical protein
VLVGLGGPLTTLWAGPPHYHHPMFHTPFEPSQEWILDRISEEQIVQRYLGITVRIGDLFRSPLRKDQNPTCVFTYYKGRLRYRDWADSRSKDVFDLVQCITGLGYLETLQDIVNRFQLRENSKPVQDIISLREERIEREKKGKKNIRVRIRDWTEQDLHYLSQFGITREIAKYFRCYPIEQAWLEGASVYYHTEKDPAIGYYFGAAGPGEERWKIYFYNRPRTPGTTRFMGNTSRINGWVQVPKEGKVVVITKSMKDVMTLARFKVPAVAMQGESTKPYPRIIDALKSRFEHVVSLYDFDLAGVRMANTLRKEYGIRPFFLTGSSKDISDHYRDKGHRATQNVIKEALISL